jgi:quercetin dioxygenase-like cupin family protein
MDPKHTLPESHTPLASYVLNPAWPVSAVKTVRREFEPGEKTGLHVHAMPVVGFVAEGAFIVQQDGEVERRYEKGDIVFEPAHVKILRFDNASPTRPASLIATYLVRDESEKLIEFLAS